MFRIKSVFSKFRCVISYAFTGELYHCQDMAEHLFRCLSAIHRLGLRLKATIMNEESSNGLYNYLYLNGFPDQSITMGLSEAHDFLISNSDKSQIVKCGNGYMPLLYNYVNLFSNIYKSIFKHDFLTPDGVMSANVYINVFNFEKKKMTCKKENTFSNSMASAIEELISEGGVFQDVVIASNTASFTRKMSKLFDILNGRYLFQLNSPEFNFLEEMTSYLEEITSTTTNEKIECIQGLVRTIRLILAITVELMGNDNCGLNMDVFNQDDVEHIFKNISRFLGRSPNAFDWPTIFSRLSAMEVMDVTFMNEFE